MKNLSRRRARSTATRGLRKRAATVLSFALALGATGLAAFGGATAASAATTDTPSYPYNVTFVWKLDPTANEANPFTKPQALITSGTDASNPSYIPAYDPECGATYQIDHYRVNNDADQAKIDGFNTSKALNSAQEDNALGGAWTQEYKAQYWQFKAAPATACERTPVAPAVKAAACTAPGQNTQPSVTPATTEGINYVVNGEVKVGADVEVVATPAAGLTLTKVAGWVPNADGSATYDVSFPNIDCTVDATPVVPEVAQAQCTAPGQLTAPTITTPTTVGVSYRVDGTPAAGATVSVVATAEAGYRLAATEGWTVNADATATATVNFADVPCAVTPTETPTATPTPSPTESAVAAVLAETGTGEGIALGLGGLVLLAGGAGAVIAARRKLAQL